MNGYKKNKPKRVKNTYTIQIEEVGRQEAVPELHEPRKKQIGLKTIESLGQLLWTGRWTWGTDDFNIDILSNFQIKDSYEKYKRREQKFVKQQS